MLAIAIWMLSRIIDTSIAMILWAALLIIIAVYLGALEPLHAKGIKPFYKGTGIIFLVYGLMLFYGGVKGEENLLAPLGSATPTNTVVPPTASGLTFKTIHSSEELNAILAQNKGKKVMLDFYADWCSSCKELDEITFKDPTVIQSLNDYVLVRADVTADSDSEKALTKRFNLFGPPAMIFFDENGKSIQGGELVGYKDPQSFTTHITTLETK